MAHIAHKSILNCRWVFSKDIIELKQIATITKHLQLIHNNDELNLENDAIRMYSDNSNNIVAFVVMRVALGIGLSVKAIWVREELRRKKIGTYALQETMNSFYDKTFTSMLFADIERNDFPNIQFFNNCGFTPIGLNQINNKQLDKIVLMAQVENKQIKPQAEFLNFMQNYKQTDS